MRDGDTSPSPTYSRVSVHPCEIVRHHRRDVLPRHFQAEPTPRQSVRARQTVSEGAWVATRTDLFPRRVNPSTREPADGFAQVSATLPVATRRHRSFQG